MSDEYNLVYSYRVTRTEEWLECIGMVNSIIPDIDILRYLLITSFTIHSIPELSDDILYDNFIDILSKNIDKESVADIYDDISDVLNNCIATTEFVSYDIYKDISDHVRAEGLAFKKLLRIDLNIFHNTELLHAPMYITFKLVFSEI